MWTIFFLTIFIYGSAKKPDEKKKSKEGEQTLAELSSVHRCSQAKCQLVQTSYIKRIKLFLFAPYNKHLITELSRPVWENVDLGRVYRPHCVRSVLTTSVKILPYRPPARLIRAKNWLVMFCIYVILPYVQIVVNCMLYFTSCSVVFLVFVILRRYR